MAQPQQRGRDCLRLKTVTALRLIEKRTERVVDTLIVTELNDIAVRIAKHAHVTDRLGQIDGFPFETTCGDRLGGNRIDIRTLRHLYTEVRKRKELRLLSAVMLVEVHQHQNERMLCRCSMSEPRRLTCIIGPTFNQPQRCELLVPDDGRVKVSDRESHMGPTRHDRTSHLANVLRFEGEE
jgi:hypothetical protein